MALLFQLLHLCAVFLTNKVAYYRRMNLLLQNFPYPTLIERPRSGGTLSKFWMSLMQPRQGSLGYPSVKIM